MDGNAWQPGARVRCIREDAFETTIVRPGAVLEVERCGALGSTFSTTVNGRRFVGYCDRFEKVEETPAAPPAGFDHFTFPADAPQPEVGQCGQQTVPDKALEFIRKELSRPHLEPAVAIILRRLLREAYGLKATLEFVPCP